MRETHLLVLQKKEKLFLALSLAAVVLCTVLAFGFAVPLQAAEPQVLPDTTGLEQYVLVDLNTADLSALCTLPGVGEKRAQTILDYRTQNGYHIIRHRSEEADTSREENLCTIIEISLLGKS